MTLPPDGGEAIQVTADGIIGKIHVRLNANTKSRRCEEIVAQKKSMHLASFRFLVEDVFASLLSMAEERGAGARLAGDPSKAADVKKFTVEGLVDAVHSQCLTVLKKHEERPAVDYAKDSVYRVLVTEALDVKAWAVSKFLLWLEDESQFIFHVMNRPLRAAYRDRISYLKKELRALGGEARRAGGPHARLQWDAAAERPGRQPVAANGLCLGVDFDDFGAAADAVGAQSRGDVRNGAALLAALVVVDAADVGYADDERDLVLVGDAEDLEHAIGDYAAGGPVAVDCSRRANLEVLASGHALDFAQPSRPNKRILPSRKP